MDILIGLESFQFTNSFYTINETNCNFAYNINSVNNNVVVAFGNYDIDSLIAYLNLHIPNLVFSYDLSTLKITISSLNNYEFILVGVSNNINEMLITKNGKFAYNIYSGNIVGYHIASDGTFNTPTSYPIYSWLSVTISPDDKFIMTWTESSFSLYSINTDGSLMLKKTIGITTAVMNEVAISNDGQTIYLFDSENNFLVYGLDNSTSQWQLNLKANKKLAIQWITSLTISKDGKFLYAASYSNKQIVQINANDLTTTIINLDPALAPLDIKTSPSGETIYVTMAMNDTHSRCINVYKQDPKTAGLIGPIQSLAITDLSDEIILNSSHNALYVINTEGYSEGGNIDTFLVNSDETLAYSKNAAGSNSISTQGIGPMSIAIGLNEQFVYVLNQTSNSIALFNAD
jgi:6-phosphogluconolactonase (cycloisomerase 2 family)